MCGIAGLIATRPVNPAAVLAMTDVQAHRGPDDSGQWVSSDGTVCLGHRRLAIQDLSPKGHQPMLTSDGALAVTFNGEIYNFPELAAHLKAHGEHFSSHCDTEVLLAAYRHWGEDCVSQFNGMFAFALYDSRRRTVFCARDRFGEKPFLFHKGNDYVAFASEYKALFSLQGVSLEWDPVRLACFLRDPATGLGDGRQTVFTDIRQLLPGERMTLDLNSLEMTIERYWDPPRPEDGVFLPHAEAVNQFRDLLRDSVRLRLRSDAPVGSCLSGGLDSGSIVCLATQERDGVPYHTFPGRFPGTTADEWDRAEAVVKATGAVSHVVAPTAEDFLRDLDAFAWANELPVGSSSQYAQWSVFKLAAEQGITVLLDGQGADELLGGYEQYFSAYLADSEGTDEAAIRARYPGALSQRDQGWKTALPFSLKRSLAHLSGRGSDILFGIDSNIADRAAPHGRPPLDPLLGALHGALEQDALHTHLPTLLRYGDRNSMAHSREVRLPFCDHRIAELVFSLAPESLMGQVQTKRILREAMEGVLPDVVRSRWAKQGFRPPQEIWFSGALGSHASAVIHDPSFAADGFWDADWWRSILKRFTKGQTHLAWSLWMPVTTEAWRRHFIDRAARLPKVEVFV